MTNLDMATIDELVEELQKRSKTCLIFATDIPHSESAKNIRVCLFAVSGDKEDQKELLAKVTMPVLFGTPLGEIIDGGEEGPE